MPSMVSMISGDDSCFVCGWAGHFGCNCPDAQCYDCNEFGHFAQDCSNKIPPSGTAHHQDRFCSRHQYTHTERDRSHSTYYGSRHETYFSRSQSCCCFHHDRSSSFRRFTACFSSSHHSSLLHPSANRCPITTPAMTPTDIVAPLSALATSPTDVTHATPQTGASLTPVTPITLHRQHSQEKPIYVQDLQPP